MDEHILQSEDEVLKAAIAQLEKDLEHRNQKLYDCKKDLQLITALEDDYLQEIESLQLLRNTEVEELQKNIKQTEESIIQLNDPFNPEILRKTDLNASLQRQVIELEKNKDASEKQRDSVTTDNDENQILKDEIKELTYHLVEMQMRIESLQTQHIELEVIHKDLLRELDDNKQNLASKLQESKEIKNLVQKLQEEIFVTKLDLESMKSKPLDPATRGNSLFAEVEDACRKTEQNIQQTKKQYCTMKHSVCVKLEAMNVLRDKNFKLSEELNAIKDFDENLEQEIEMYKNKISTLESSISTYKEELQKQVTITGKGLPDYAVEFANNVIRSKWNDEEKAREQLYRKSKETLETCKAMKDADTESRKWQRKNHQLEVKIEELENSIFEIQLQDSAIEEDIKESKKIATNNKGIVAEVENSTLENKSVTFVTGNEHKMENNAENSTKDGNVRKTSSCNNSVAKISQTCSKTTNNLNMKSFDNRNKSPSCDLNISANLCNISTNGKKTLQYDNETNRINLEPDTKIQNINETIQKSEENPRNSVSKNLEICNTTDKDFYKDNIMLHIENTMTERQPEICSDVEIPRQSGDRNRLLSYMKDIGHVSLENQRRVFKSVDSNLKINESCSTNTKYSLSFISELNEESLMEEENRTEITLLTDSFLSTTENLNRLSRVDTQLKDCGDVTQNEFSDQFVSSNENSFLYLNAGHTPGSSRKKIIKYYTLTTPECHSESDIDENSQVYEVKNMSGQKHAEQRDNTECNDEETTETEEVQANLLEESQVSDCILLEDSEYLEDVENYDDNKENLLNVNLSGTFPNTMSKKSNSQSISEAEIKQQEKHVLKRRTTNIPVLMLKK